MKRRILRLLIFLLLGSIVNVAMAWGCAINAERSWRRQPLVSGTARDWGVSVPNDWPLPQVSVESIRFGFSLKSAVRFRFSFGSAAIRTHAVVVSACGVPAKSLMAVVRSPSENTDKLDSTQAGIGLSGESGILIRRDNVSQYAPLPGEWNHEEWLTLPLRPLWPGFAINTLFYAAILWLLFATPFALRRWRRIQRDLCPACAYPVGTSDLCTECGKPIPLSLRERVRVRGSTS